MGTIGCRIMFDSEERMFTGIRSVAVCFFIWPMSPPLIDEPKPPYISSMTNYLTYRKLFLHVASVDGHINFSLNSFEDLLPLAFRSVAHSIPDH